MNQGTLQLGACKRLIDKVKLDRTEIRQCGSKLSDHPTQEAAKNIFL